MQLARGTRNDQRLAPLQVTPSRGLGETGFGIRVRKPSALDYERVAELRLQLAASEVAEPFRQTAVEVCVTNETPIMRLRS